MVKTSEQEEHMKFIVVATPRVTPPPELILGLIDRAEVWYRRYEEKFEAFGTFPEGVDSASSTCATKTSCTGW